VADRKGQEKEAQDDTDNIAQGVPRTHPSLVSGQLGDRSGVVDRQETGDVSTVTVAVNYHTEALSAPVVQANARKNAVGLPSLCQSGSPVFIRHFYQRLPHRLSHVLKELPVVDGTDISLLCDLWMKVHTIRQVGQIADRAICEIMYPHCWSELLALVTNVIKM
jgi:hypothetical protein